MFTTCHVHRPARRPLMLATLALALLAPVPALAQAAGRPKPPPRPQPTQPSATQPATAPKSDPYPLETCPVSGKKLGSMGDPVVKTIDGREVRFCCGGCIATFEADPATYWARIDKQIVKTQMPFYPLATCPVSGETLGEMGAPVDYVYHNRLVRFCCKGCVRTFLKDPTPVLAKLDEAVVAQQGPRYPMTTCVVSGEVLGGEMGKPVERVFDNHLVRFCCTGCLKDFEKDPARYLATLDAAWRKQGGPPATGDDDEPAGHDHDHH